MKKFNKKVIIFSTNDKIISIPLVYHIVSQKKFKNIKFDIYFINSKIIRKIKVLLSVVLFGSLPHLLSKFSKSKSKNDLKIFNNVNLIDEFENKKYDYGLSVYFTKKLKVQKYKIYNFHLGSLLNQRGSFIFFYKFFEGWSKIDLTFHEIEKDFDKGNIINTRTIFDLKKMNASEIMTLYLENKNFLIESIDKLNKSKSKKKLKTIKKLYMVPSFLKIFYYYLKYLVK